MQLTTILNRVEYFKSFVYGKTKWVDDADRPTIDCDLHMHTDHSGDCATPVEVLLETARDRGMGAIAVTDHGMQPATSQGMMSDASS